MASSAVENRSKTPADRVRQFREKHGLTTGEMDRLMGFTSNGRATRRWEAEDAPPYVEVLMVYMDKFGLAEARLIATDRELPA